MTKDKWRSSVETKWFLNRINEKYEFFTNQQPIRLYSRALHVASTHSLPDPVVDKPAPR